MPKDTITQADVNPFPAKGTAQYRLLDALLGGEVIDPVKAIFDLNVGIIAARVSELRRLGWPIRSVEVPHPNLAKFPDAVLPAYVLDQHFRLWIGGREGNGQHPCAYPYKDGRGKFADWNEDDYRADAGGTA